MASKLAELPVTLRGLSPLVSVKINGKAATLLLDSGAFYSTLQPGSLETFGLTKAGSPGGIYSGGVGGKSVSLDVGQAASFDIANSHFHKANFFVFESGFGREVDGLLGQNRLGAADTEYDLANAVVRLFQPKGYDHTRMAYWVADQPYSVLDFHPVSDGDPTPAAMV